MTMRYAHLTPQVKESAISLLDPTPQAKTTEAANGTTAAHGPKEAVQAA
jgi:hypothetical protein